MVVLSIGAISAEDVDDAIASNSTDVVLGESESVSGGVDVVTENPWNTTGELSYDIPSDAKAIKSADVYVNVYAGSANTNYGANANITITTDNDEVKHFEPLWIEEGSSDGTVYIVNGHTTKCYSDYMIHYDITDMLNALNGTNLAINVETFAMDDKQFDGRIKLIALILAYDDGDSDSISYWINDDQLWTKQNVTVTFDTADVGLFTDASLRNVVLSSGDGTYILNGDLLEDSEIHESGNYYQYNEWDVSNFIKPAQQTDLNVVYAGTSAWGSIKNVLSVLTVNNYVSKDFEPVSGGVDVVTENPWNTTGELSYDIPSDAKAIKSADVYVNVYAGSANTNYGANANITITTDNDEVKHFEPLWIEEGSSDGTVYIVNGHTTKCYSDYMIHYDITDMLNALNGTNLAINVETFAMDDKQFDGRIKLIALILAYDDGDSDSISYWINDDQLWTKQNVTVTFDTADVGLFTDASLRNVVLSSGDGTYILNGDLLEDSEIHESGNYYQYNEWDVSNFIKPAQQTDLNVVYAGTSAWGSIKNVLSVLTINNYVDRKEKTVLNAKDIVTVYNATSKYYVALKDADGNPITGVKVNLVLGSVNKTVRTDSKGWISASIKNFAAGNYSVVASFAGNDLYAPANTTATVIVNKIPTTLNAKDIVTVYNTTSKYYVALKDADGNPITGVKVNLVLGSVNKTVRTDSKGWISASIKNFAAGNYSVVASFAGNDLYAPANTTATLVITQISTVLKAKNIVTVYNDTSKYYVALKDADGNPLVGVKVNLVLGTINKTVKTDSKGRISASIKNLAPGNYSVVASFAGDDLYAPVTTTANVVVNKIATQLTAKNVAIAYNSSYRYYVALKDVDGNPLVGVKVNLVLGSINKTVKTDANGKISASLKNLAAGNYTAVISCAGTEIYDSSNTTANVVIS